MQGIGQLLWKLREKEGIRQKQLCLGISSVSKYARIEADQQEIDFFLIDRIMGRLGKSVERLTYILPRDIYNIYELRQEIQQKICQKKWEEAKQCLLEYEKNKRAKEPLHQQFIEQEYAQILEKENSNAEFIGLLRQERASLLELESDYKVSFKNYRLFDHVVRNFEIDAELIRRTRNAAKLTQEGLSEDICAQETLARIENGNQKPRSGNLRQMMEKMGRSGDRIETGIQVEEYETLELKIEFSKFIHRKEYGNAEKVLSKIEEKLDCNLMKNYQYIETERVKVKYKENAEYTEQFIKQLKELLAMSLKVEEGQKIEYVLNTEEISILTEMALIYWGEQNYKVALEIYQFLVGQYEKSFIKPVFHILDWGMSMGNYGMALEELGYFEKAIGVCRERIQQTLFAGKGGSLHTSLMVEACILEAQKDVKCKKYFKQDLDLLRLYKMQTNYKLMESYVKTNKIFD